MEFTKSIQISSPKGHIAFVLNEEKDRVEVIHDGIEPLSFPREELADFLSKAMVFMMRR